MVCKILKTCQGKKFEIPPVWIMRQAGRYLPEYRQIRSNVPDFLSLCYNSKLACEVTLQPIKRFDLDAAILFSDILVPLNALGLEVKFVKNHGPQLENIKTEEDLSKISKINYDIFSRINDTVASVRANLAKEKALIGFCGSPWTVATYALESKSIDNFKISKIFAYNRNLLDKLIEILIETSIIYLEGQIKAGADIIKLFDSWAGALNNQEYERYCIEPNKKIVDYFRKNYPHIPIICLAKGSGEKYRKFADNVKPDILALDQQVDLSYMQELNNHYNIQGNLDPFILLLQDKRIIKQKVKDIIENLKNAPKAHIFNLGHGILPKTPIENVELLIDTIRNN